MTRKELLAEVARCVAQHGYPFKTGFAYRINSELSAPPEVWAEPPQLISRKGREEGTKEYKVTLRLIDTPPLRIGNEPANEMEEALDKIISSLNGHDEILKTGPVEYTTEENTLSNKGDVSLKAVFTILIRF